MRPLSDHFPIDFGPLSAVFTPRQASPRSLAVAQSNHLVHYEASMNICGCRTYRMPKSTQLPESKFTRRLCMAGCCQWRVRERRQVHERRWARETVGGRLVDARGAKAVAAHEVMAEAAQEAKAADARQAASARERKVTGSPCMLPCH